MRALAPQIHYPSSGSSSLLRRTFGFMGIFTMVFCALLVWPQALGSQSVQDHYSNGALARSLTQGLQWLSEELISPIDTAASGIACPPKPSAGAADNNRRWICAHAALNTKLASANPAHYLPTLPPEAKLKAELVSDVQIALDWLNRHAKSGDHALALISNPEQAAAQNGLRDPFRLAGCFFTNHAPAFATSLALASAPSKLAPTSACPEAAVQDATNALPHIQNLLTPVHQYSSPLRGQSPNTRSWANASSSTQLMQGRHVSAAWHQPSQDFAQTTAACYTGDLAACQQCHWCNKEQAGSMFESARARAMGILIVDVQTGAVEAAASAYTPCYASRQKGERAAQGCPQLPSLPDGTPPKRSHRNNSQSLMQMAAPGSQVKLPIALGLLEAGLTRQEAQTLPSILTRSASTELIDMVMCKSQGFAPDCARHRLSSIARLARRMDAGSSHADILSAGQIDGLHAPVFASRLLDFAHPAQSDDWAQLQAQTLRACSQKPPETAWRNCQGRVLNNLLAELFGTGNALASPVGMANTLLQLAAVANGQASAAQAHLIAWAQRSDGTSQSVQPSTPLAFSRAVAQPVLQGLQDTHTFPAGTARSACASARKATPSGAWHIACTANAAQSIRVASKTGTPVFSGDRKPLPVWRAECQNFADELARTRQGHARWYTLRNEIAKCQMPPMKWYSMLVGLPGSSTWDKVVVVLSERNFNQSTQMVDNVNDEGPNVSAEAGLAVVNALYAASLAGSQWVAKASPVPAN